MLSTEIALNLINCILHVDKKQFHQSQKLKEDSLVTSLALGKQLLTNQDQVIMPS